MVSHKICKQLSANRKKTHFFLIRIVIISILLASGTQFLLPEGVQAAPIITSGPPPSGQIGIPYNFIFSATCNGTCNWSISGSIPPGLVASGNIITGTPTTGGIFPITVTVSDTLGSTSANYTITITAPALTFITTSIPNATVGQSYSASIVATGGTGTITYTLTSGTLPTGLSLSPTGVISGTPAKGTAGNYTFTVTATAGSSTAQMSFGLIVEKGSFEALVSISNGLAEGQTNLYIDNTVRATLRGGESVKLKIDPESVVTVSVDSIVTAPSRSDIRYKAESNSATITEGISQVRFNYFPEYNIELKSEPSGIVTISGSGWYREGTTLTATAPDEAPKDADSLYRFSYWLMPGGDKIRSQTLNTVVNAPGKYIATYDLFFRFTVVSQYGNAQGTGWYKAGDTAKWSISPAEVAMSGIMGFFGGKYKAPLTSGTEIIDGAKTITISWDQDYSTPAVTIPLAILAVAGIVYGIYALAKKSKGPQMAPYPTQMQSMPPPPPLPPYPIYSPPPPQQLPPQPMPIPPPQTTVVMIGDGGIRKSPQTTREQLMEKFGELLQKYEEELAGGREIPPSAELPEAATTVEKKSLPAPEIIADTDSAPNSPVTGKECGFSTKKLLRTVVTPWKNTNIKPIVTTPGDKKNAGLGGGRTVTWTRETYNEWELHVCKLADGHKGTHKGTTEIIYSILETINEERNYGPKQALKPPSPHYTDGMPEIDISASQIIPPDQLPS